MVILRFFSPHVRLALRAGRIGLFEWDLLRGTVEATDEMAEFHGIPLDRRPHTPMEWLRVVAQEDRGRMVEAIRQMLAGRDETEVDVRVPTSAGPCLWKRVTAEVVRDTSGRPVRVLGASVDITEWRAGTQEQPVATMRCRVLGRSNPAAPA